VLIASVICGALSMGYRSNSRIIGWSPLTLAVAAFLCATLLSLVVSADIIRSLRLSTPLLLATLLFMLTTTLGGGAKEVRILYLALSAMSLWLAATLLWTAWALPDEKALNFAISEIGIPIVIVPNDVTVLAVLAPLSLVLLCHERPRAISLIPAASLLLSMAAICACWSRTAVLTMGFSLAIAAAFSHGYRQRRFWVAAAPVALVLGLLISIDLPQFPGPSLLTKFSQAGLNGRMSDWNAAWAMFLDAPFLGQGPHTYGLFHHPVWAHNLYLELLAEQGIVGLISFGCVLAAGIAGGRRLQRTPTEDARLLGAGALASLIALCGAGFFELTLAREWVVTVLFTLLGVIGQLVLYQSEQRRGEK
jgi:hypothetical protein